MSREVWMKNNHHLHLHEVMDHTTSMTGHHESHKDFTEQRIQFIITFTFMEVLCSWARLGWKDPNTHLCQIFTLLVLGCIQQVTSSGNYNVSAPQHKSEVEHFPVDCQDVWDIGQTLSGVYTIYPQGLQRPLPVYCDMTTGGKVWTVFQRRLDGSLNFNQSWQNYVSGFGNADGEYWLGLQNIYRLTMRGEYELRLELEDRNGNRVSAQYMNFSLSRHALNPNSDGYRLHIGAFKDEGAGDALSLHNGHMFSTYDKDQDEHILNCAEYYGGGFWYNSEGCAEASLNARYNTIDSTHPAFSWTTWVDFPETLQGSQMKIRRIPA
ncbi:microfibril-associated glycoprotein 4-like [Leptodactylus fuscus]|uniref:microfibril-associated glycoprotein 4-like n=1 Tax=Leptodactylus fuscus TaxID=238119 RepID=UPI003F4EA778